MKNPQTLHPTIINNIFWVHEAARYIGCFPYDIVTLKSNKMAAVLTCVVHVSAITLFINGYFGYKAVSSSPNKEFYSVILTKILLLTFAIKSTVFLFYRFRIRNRLQEILSELNRIHGYFLQLSCLDVLPEDIAWKQTLTIILFCITHVILFIYRIVVISSFNNHITFAIYLLNFLTCSTILQCTNLLDVVKHYLNIINVELVDISNNQDKQHFIHLYKSRICILNNMLPENYLCRRKLKILLLLHFSLCKISHKIVNHHFALPLTVIVLTEGIQLTTNLFFIVTLYMFNVSLLAVWTMVLYIGVFSAYNITVLVWIINHCETTKVAAQSASEIVYHKLIYAENPLLHSELTDFLDKISTQKIRFTVFEFFDIDFTILRPLLGAVLSFGVILIQLSITT